MFFFKFYFDFVLIASCVVRHSAIDQREDFICFYTWMNEENAYLREGEACSCLRWRRAAVAELWCEEEVAVSDGGARPSPSCGVISILHIDSCIRANEALSLDDRRVTYAASLFEDGLKNEVRPRSWLLFRFVLCFQALSYRGLRSRVFCQISFELYSIIWQVHAY